MATVHVPSDENVRLNIASEQALGKDRLSDM